MTTIAQRLVDIRNRITDTEQRYGRPPGAVRLLAVSKTKPPEAVGEAFEAGQPDFGENQLQDAMGKLDALSDLAIDWHFIGPVQSNKTRPIAQRFAWVHSVDREKTARRLSEQRPDGTPPLKVCIQVNTSEESTKSGVGLAEVAALAGQIVELPGLELRGLMTIPAPGGDLVAQRAPFRRLREKLEALNASGHQLDTLSMGMTDDMEAAIAEGATMVRIGTAIFGPRRSAG